MDHSQQLLHYYQHIYPTQQMYKFIRSTPNREFSSTISNNVYIRYLSFHTPEALSSFLLRKVPEKIDIGCIYTTRPDTAIISSDLIPLEKELVFDIDLTDYTRACCVGKTICNECMALMKCGARIMDHILRHIFGFKQIMYCFSGGRGIHIWVCDKEAMCLNNSSRKGVVDFFTIRNGMKIPEVKDIINDYGQAKDRNLWDTYFVKLDKNVSVDIKHLLKAPFSIHQSSKNVSVPMSLEMLEEFSIEKIISLGELVENHKLLGEYVEYFEDFIKQI